MIKQILSVSLLLMALSTQAQVYTPVKNGAKVQQIFVKMSDDILSMQSDFIQTKYYDFMDEPLISEGKLIYQKQDKFRWQYFSPVNYLLLVDGDKVRIWDNGREQKYTESVDKVFRQVRELILGCISGSILSDTQYQTKISSNGEFYKVELNPTQKEMRNFVERIEIYIDERHPQIRKIKLIDPNGDWTEIRLTNSIINQSIKESVFHNY